MWNADEGRWPVWNVSRSLGLREHLLQITRKCVRGGGFSPRNGFETSLFLYKRKYDFTLFEFCESKPNRAGGRGTQIRLRMNERFSEHLCPSYAHLIHVTGKSRRLTKLFERASAPYRRLSQKFAQSSY